MAKIRTGFVSNSSSSSFIISSKTEKPKMTLSISIEDIVDYTAVTEADVNHFFLEQYGYDTIEEMLAEADYFQEPYDKAIQAIRNGDTVYFGNVSNESGNAYEELIYEHGFSGEKNFDVILSGE